MSNAHRETMTKVTDACSDDAEVLALSTLRMIAAGYSTGDIACWDMAYAGAERLLCPEFAGRLVASVTTLMRALRAERSGAWSFLPVTCCRVTPDEERLVRLVAAARSDDPHETTWAACEVTRTAGAPSIVTAARVVARVLDRTAGALASRPDRRDRPAAVH